MSSKSRKYARSNVQIRAFEHNLEHLHSRIDKDKEDDGEGPGATPKKVTENKTGTLYKF